MQPKIIPLTEYEAAHFAPAEISTEVGEILLRHYPTQVEVDFPTPKTNGLWQLRPLGWVGHLPLTPDLHLALQPKVPLDNIFGMLEYAYRLDIDFLKGTTPCTSLAEFYERLALVLARRVLTRGRQGFYRAYLPQTDSLPYVRGRLDARAALHRPGTVNLTCHYEEHTADIIDNQLLAYTLWRIARSGLCSERSLPTVRRAYRALQGLVTLTPHPPAACLNRLYHRLNEDYRPLHGLCRFFLEQSGPGHTLGDRTMLPFLVNMARLYELFVAEWLKSHHPPTVSLKVQERVSLSHSHNLRFDIDLVLYDAVTGVPRCVLDTKYKAASIPTHDDIFQIITYAEATGCREAILIYPTPLPRPLDDTIGAIHVRSVTFALNGDLEQAGQKFIKEVIEGE